MSSTIQANTACESLSHESALADTCKQIINQQIPNLLRLYLNPYVAQSCYCLAQYVKSRWDEANVDKEYQVFLANSLEESLSGAIKLARYHANSSSHANQGLIIDDENRLEHFARTELGDGSTLEYLPEVEVLSDLHSIESYLAESLSSLGFIVFFHSTWNTLADAIREELAEAQRLGLMLIVCTDLHAISDRARAQEDGLVPDIVVFDESFTNHEVPFGAFAASKQLYDCWNQRGMTTFHSTTYQPNTISSLHLMNCLRAQDPEFIQEHDAVLQCIENEKDFRLDKFRALYSPSLTKLISTVGFNQDKLRALGHYIYNDLERIFDGVAGVACSLRGHNPSTYLSDLESIAHTPDTREELSERLYDLTGLQHAVPAVSGASAVEQALKIGLACQSPRNYVLALQGGFGGKTLFALTGTWKQSLKSGLAPLYPNVVYIDPFAEDARQQLNEAFQNYPIGVVQLELIQGVGGVREIPERILQHLQQLRDQYECLLFVDEVQTGVFRTGPFVRSQALDIEPDILTIGKATSDMMFPFAMTLYSDEVQAKLDSRNCYLPNRLESRYGYDFGYRTLLNTLRSAEQQSLESHVRKQGQFFADLLNQKLGSCSAVNQVRDYGLLIGIELNTKNLRFSWLKRLWPKLCLLGMLKHPEFPLLMGFCQYEPHVLKFTPPLSVSTEEIHSISETVASVLQSSPYKLFASMIKRRFFS